MTDPWSVTDVPVHLAEPGEDTRSAIGDWSQGDLVEGLPTTWLAPQIDVVTGVGLEDRRQGPEGDGEVLEPVFDPDATGTWVIASQTCDIGAGSPGSHHAFVLVAPLTPAKRLPPSTTGLALKGGVNYLVPVDHERQEQEAPRWFADLRMLMPVSKAVLLTRHPRSAFASEEATLKFAEHLGAKFRRPALHAALSEELGRAINRHIQKRMKQSLEKRLTVGSSKRGLRCADSSGVGSLVSGLLFTGTSEGDGIREDGDQKGVISSLVASLPGSRSGTGNPESSHSYSHFRAAIVVFEQRPE